MKRVFTALLGVFCVGAFAHIDEFTDSDSGIHGPKYSAIVAQFEQLQAANPTLTQWIDYGQTHEGRPLRMMMAAKPQSSRGPRPTLFMSGSTHGNEYLNLEDRLPGEILKRAETRGTFSTFLSQGGVMIFVPILNPDGYDHRQRGNSKGVDLNRDWDVKPAGFVGFKQPETKNLAGKLAALKQQYNLDFKLTVDYHCCAGALLYPWSYNGAPALPQADQQRFLKIGDLVNKEMKVEVGTTPEVLGYGAMGTTKDYYYATYGALGFTYEGEYAAENKNLNQHLNWWEAITNFIMAEDAFARLDWHHAIATLTHFAYAQ